MLNRAFVATLVGASLFSFSSLAAQPNWNNVQLSYAKMDVDDTDISGNGFELAGSVLLGSNIILQGNYLSVSDEVLGAVDVDFDWLTMGVGYRHPVTAATDVYALVSYENVELSASYDGESESEDDNGYGLTLGVRTMLSEQWELEGAISRVDIEDAETFFKGGLSYHINSQFAVGAAYKVGDDLDVFTLSARYSF